MSPQRRGAKRVVLALVVLLVLLAGFGLASVAHEEGGQPISTEDATETLSLESTFETGGNKDEEDDGEATVSILRIRRKTNRPTTRRPVTRFPTRRPTKFPTTRNPTTRRPTHFPTTRSPTTRRPTRTPTLNPTRQCPEIRCGANTCIPFGATCCNPTTGFHCQPGSSCLPVSPTVWSCCPHGICDGKCCPCPSGEKKCGDACVPDTAICCETNRSVCPSNSICIQTLSPSPSRLSSKVCHDCGSRGVCALDKCCQCEGPGTPTCAGLLPKCCKVTTFPRLRDWTCGTTFEKCCPDGSTCSHGSSCTLCSGSTSQYCCE